MPRVVAELEIDCVEKLMLCDMRLGEKKADLAAVDEGPPFARDGIKRQIEPGLELFGHTIGPFSDAVIGTLRHNPAWEFHFLAADRRVVIVKSQARLPNLVDLAVIDLDFVGLRRWFSGKKREQSYRR